MNYSEVIAKMVFEAVHPGAVLIYREGQSHGEYDFDLHYANGSRAAVEVTAAVDEAQAQIVAAIHNKRKGGSKITAVMCKKSWIIFLANDASISNIRENADQQLARLEQEGIDNFSWVRNESPSVRDVCMSLRLTNGSVIAAEDKPGIRIASPVGGGAVGAILAIKVGEYEAWKLDNQKKLGAAKTTERHLAVYIEARNGLPWTALTSFDPPPVLPKIPDEITTLWLIGDSDKNEFSVWYASTGKPWCGIKLTISSAVS